MVAVFAPPGTESKLPAALREHLGVDLTPAQIQEKNIRKIEEANLPQAEKERLKKGIQGTGNAIDRWEALSHSYHYDYFNLDPAVLKAAAGTDKALSKAEIADLAKRARSSGYYRFAIFFADALQGTADRTPWFDEADTDQNGTLSVPELNRYIHERNLTKRPSNVNVNSQEAPVLYIDNQQMQNRYVSAALPGKRAFTEQWDPAAQKFMETFDWKKLDAVANGTSTASTSSESKSTSKRRRTKTRRPKASRQQRLKQRPVSKRLKRQRNTPKTDPFVLRLERLTTKLFQTLLQGLIRR